MPLHEAEQASVLAPTPAANDEGTDTPNEPRNTSTRNSKKNKKRREYRGIFSSSICDMFSSPSRSRTDACALACCGIWLWERNEFLLRGNHPKRWTQRPLEVILLCMLLAVIALAAVDPKSQALAVCLLVVVVLGVWRLLEFQSSRNVFRREMAVEEFRRQNLMRSNDDDNFATAGGGPAQNNSRDEQQESSELQNFLSRHWNEISRRHNLLNCVKDDTNFVFDDGEEYDDDEDEGEFDVDDEDDRDFCQRLWQCMGNLCCNTCCMCWCVWCGMCAIAQEHRHLVKVLPDAPSLWQRDYITMQPWCDYFPSILILRQECNTSFVDHFKALSHLSSKLVKACGIFLLFPVILTLCFPVRYGKWQLVIALGALVEPLVLLFFTYWYWNRLDISLDAIIKYFSSGFFLCMSLVLVYEAFANVLASMVLFAYTFLGTVVLLIFGDFDQANLNDVNVDGENFWDAINPGQPGGNTTATATAQEAKDVLKLPLAFVLSITVLGALLQSCAVAALVEETFKYLSFWMVEHPDMEDGVSLEPVPGNDHANNGNRNRGENSTLLASESQAPTHKSIDQESNIRSLDESSYKHRASMESRGAAITVSMIAVAIGFAFAENLLYIFVYTAEKNFKAETTTLILRALFPVHPLCAAIQSIAVVQRDVEKDRSVGMGRIIGAAFLLHGAFDFILMAYSGIAKLLHKDGAPQTEYEISKLADWIIFSSALLIPAMGLEYYFYQARKQTKRLVDLDTGRVSSSQQVTPATEVV